MHLIIKGELLQPQIAFDMVLPEEKSYNVSTDVIDNVQTQAHTTPPGARRTEQTGICLAFT